MNRRFFRMSIFAVIAIALMSLSIGAPSVAQGSGSGTITIMHTQEHHGQVEPASPFGQPDVGGVAYNSTVINGIRDEVGADNAILLNSGDILIGTPLSSVFRGEPDILAFNAMGYDGLAIGNHMFDFESVENRFEILTGLADFPLMGANVENVGFDADPGFVKLNRGGMIVLVIGIGNVETPEVANPNPDTVFNDPIQTVRDVIAAEGDDADVIIALTHEDTNRDVDLLQSVPELDVVIGGHTFGFNGIVTRGTFGSIDEVPDAISDQSNSVDSPDGIFVRAGGGPLNGRLGSVVGQLDLVVENGVVVSATATNNIVYPDTEDNQADENLSADDLVSADPEIQSILDPFLVELDSRLSQPIGETTVDLDGERANVRSRETNLGNFIADVLRTTQGTDIGFVNSGGVRNSIAAGPITRGDVLGVQPFGNTVVTFDITGAQLLEAMENSVSQIEEGAGRFAQISGMTLTFDSSAESGSRVIEITVGGAALDESATYSIATNNFVASGGDGYTVFTQGTNFRDTQFVDADVLADFISDQGIVSPTVEGRITDVATN